MVICDVDHPDIEEFISWKVKEEQKVAALVAGSKLLQVHANAIIAACHDESVTGDKLDAKNNKVLAKAVPRSTPCHAARGVDSAGYAIGTPGPYRHRCARL